MVHFDFLLQDIRDLVLAGDPIPDPTSFQIELPSDPRHICSRLMEDFMSKALDEYLNIYRMVCQNRCRIRRTFTQAIGILDQVESEAYKTDQELAKWSTSLRMKDRASGGMVELDPLSTWTKFYKLKIMVSTRL